MKEVWKVEKFDGMQADTDENNFKKLNKKIMKPSDPNPHRCLIPNPQIRQNLI